MASTTEGTREGNLEAPTRHPLDWTGPLFYDEENLFGELERVYDICHGCRRCFNLCNSLMLLTNRNPWSWIPYRVALTGK